MSDETIVPMPIRHYPELGRLYTDLEKVLDNHRDEGIPHAAVLGVLTILMDTILEEKRHISNE